MQKASRAEGQGLASRRDGFRQLCLVSDSISLMISGSSEGRSVPPAPERAGGETTSQTHPCHVRCRSLTCPQPEPEQQWELGHAARLLGAGQRAAGRLPPRPLPRRLPDAREKCVRPAKRLHLPVRRVAGWQRVRPEGQHAGWTQPGQHQYPPVDR